MVRPGQASGATMRIILGFDSERQPVSAISSTADDGSPNPSDPDALVDASRGGLGVRPAESVEQAAGLLAEIAKLLSPV
jgi:hypothetical protein